MKINWGAGIVIAIVLFITFIMVMVVTMVSDKEYNHDLVTEKYYQKELEVNDNMKALNNTKSLKEEFIFHKQKEGLRIYFPKSLNKNKIEGKVFLYRPSNKQLDFEMPISNLSPYLLVPEKRLLGGRWNITLSFKHKNKDFLYQKELMY